MPAFKELWSTSNENIKPHFDKIKVGPNGGEGGIRTLGDLRHVGFQDRCIKPDSATSPVGETSPEVRLFARKTVFKSE